MNAFLNSLASSPAVALLAVAVWCGAVQSLSCLLWRRKEPEFVFWAASLFPAGLLVLLLNVAVCRAPAWVLWGVLSAAALPGWRSFFRLRPDKALLTALVLAGIAGLGSAMIPPYSWDEQTYQAALLRRFCENGSAAVFLDNPYSAFPLLPHFLELPLYRLGGLTAVKLLVWALYLAMFYQVFKTVEGFGRGRTVALMLSLAWFLPSGTIDVSREIYAEIFILLLSLGALKIYWQKDGEKSPDPQSNIALLSFSAGILAVKISAFPIALAVGAMSWDGKKKKNFRSLVPPFAGLAAGGVFYLRSFLYTGNPVYPFGAAVFGGSPADAAVEAVHMDMGRAKFALHGAWGVLYNIFLMAFDGDLFDGYVFGWQLPVLLAAALFFGWGREKKTFCVLGVLYVFWSLTSPQSRFFQPLWLLIVLLAGRHWPEKGKCRVFLLCLTGAATLVSLQWNSLTHFYYGYVQYLRYPGEPFKILVNATRDKEFFDALDFLAEKTAPEDEVMLIFERRTLYVPRRFRIADPSFQARYLTPVPENAEELWRFLQKSGVAYILVGESERNPDFQSRLRDEYEKLALELRELLRQGKLQLVFSGGNPVLKVSAPPSFPR